MATLEGVSLRYYLGDTWWSPQWAVLIDDQPVDLSVGGWVARCQVRRGGAYGPLLHEWSTLNSRIQLDVATVKLGETDLYGQTSTIQLVSPASETEVWEEFSADFEVEIVRGSGPEVERHTIVTGRMTAVQGVIHP